MSRAEQKVKPGVCWDGGTCHHTCPVDVCWRQENCGPLSGAEPAAQTQPDLRTESAIDALVTSIQHDLDKATHLLMSGLDVLEYVEQRTAPWLDVTPGRLKAKVGELKLVIAVLGEEADEIGRRMKGATKLPAVEVIKHPPQEDGR